MDSTAVICHPVNMSYKVNVQEQSREQRAAEVKGPLPSLLRAFSQFPTALITKCHSFVCVQTGSWVHLFQYNPEKPSQPCLHATVTRQMMAQIQSSSKCGQVGLPQNIEVTVKSLARALF